SACLVGIGTRSTSVPPPSIATPKVNMTQSSPRSVCADWATGNSNGPDPENGTSALHACNRKVVLLPGPACQQLEPPRCGGRAARGRLPVPAARHRGGGRNAVRAQPFQHDRVIGRGERKRGARFACLHGAPQ